MSTAAMLKNVDVFQSLTPEEVEKVNKFSAVKEYQANETIYEHDRPVSHVFLLLQGGVQLRMPAAQGQVSIVIDKVEKGEFFGLAPMLDGARYTVTAQTTTTASVLAIEAKPFRELLQGNARVGLEIMTLVANAYSARYIETLGRLQSVANEIMSAR
jgi:thioredoxin reductase (NADPH)